MATIKEVRKSLDWLSDVDVTLLHCVSEYPCKEPLYDRIDILKELGYPVGLSDHSKNIRVPRGLPVYEKHFMIENMNCIDKNVSITQHEFKEMVELLK